MAIEITVFGRENCSSCKSTKAFLTSKKVDFVDADLDTSELALTLAKENNIMQAPVTIGRDTENGEIKYVTGGFIIKDLVEIVNGIHAESVSTDDALWDY